MALLFQPLQIFNDDHKYAALEAEGMQNFSFTPAQPNVQMIEAGDQRAAQWEWELPFQFLSTRASICSLV